MIEYIFIGAIGFGLTLLYCLINSQGTMCKLFRKLLNRDIKRNRCKLYLERFREHKQNDLSRNIVLQIFPWLGVLALVFILSNQYFVFGTVLSRSMMPTFSQGDLVLMQTIDKTTNVDDIVMFTAIGVSEPVTHRITKIYKDGTFKTKGDANPTEDDWILVPRQIQAKAIIMGNKPIVLKGLGYYIDPAKIGPFTVLTKVPKNVAVATAFQRFRTLQPLILLFGTIFYFFILIETRMEQNRRFNNHKNGRNGKNGFLNGIVNGTKAR